MNTSLLPPIGGLGLWWTVPLSSSSVACRGTVSRGWAEALFSSGPSQAEWTEAATAAVLDAMGPPGTEGLAIFWDRRAGVESPPMVSMERRQRLAHGVLVSEGHPAGCTGSGAPCARNDRDCSGALDGGDEGSIPRYEMRRRAGNWNWRSAHRPSRSSSSRSTHASPGGDADGSPKARARGENALFRMDRTQVRVCPGPVFEM